MISSFETFVNKHHLFHREHKLLLALSGGRDSVALAYVLKYCGYHFAIAHCNFQLRASESETDAVFCQQLAQDLECSYFSVRFDTTLHAKKNKLSIQMAARELRLNWLEDIRQSSGYDYILFGHHADDQAETFFINLIRGSGIAGLRGMKPKQGFIIRPLLFATRLQIDAFIHAHAISYRDDSSNAGIKYLRNNIRHHLIPAFKKTHTNAFNGLLKSMQFLAEDQLLYEALLMEEKKRLIEKKGEMYVISKHELIEHSGGKTLIFKILYDFGFSTAQAEMISTSINGQAGKRFKSPDWELRINRETIEIVPAQVQEVSPVVTIPIQTKAIVDPLRLSFTSMLATELNQILQDSTIALIDSDLISYPLTLRLWKKGDRFQPLGMKGFKLLSDFFIDQHYTMTDKNNAYVITSSNGDIIWIVGNRIDNRYKITKQTKNILKIEFFQ